MIEQLKSFEEWFEPLEQGVNEAWFGDAEEAVKKFGSLYEQYVREWFERVQEHFNYLQQKSE